MMDKPTLRKEMAVRRAQAAATVDQAPARAALSALLAETEGPVSFFWPIRSEIDTRPVMEALAETRTVCLPVTAGRQALTFRRWHPGVRMEKDGFGVPIPIGSETVVPEVLVVPMLAFDDAGNRLGYGAGHYDRTLAALRPNGPVTAIGFAFEAQRVETALPIEPTDQPLDYLVTEMRCDRLER